MTGGSTHQLVHCGGLALRTSGNFIPADKFFKLATALATLKVEHRHEVFPE